MGQTEIITQLERSHMTKRRRKIYTALEEVNFHWDWDEVVEVIRLWKVEEPFDAIAERFDRDPDELGLLIMDLARKGRIKPRRRGIE